MPRRKYYSYYNKKTSSAVVALNTVIIVLLSIIILLIGLYIFSHFSGYTIIPFDKINFPWSESTAVNSDEVVVIEPGSSFSAEQPSDEPIVIAETSTAASETTTIAVVVGETSEVASESAATIVTEPKIPLNVDSYSDEFYSNTLFIGDSIFTGLAAFEYLPPENVFAQVGLNPDSVLTKKINDVTVFEKASVMQPERVCIMLGTNGLAFLDVDYMVSNMKKVVNELRAVCPDTQIVLISIPPVTEEHEKDNPEKIPLIKEYNSLIEEIADEMECEYVDIYSLLIDETGYFSSDYAEVDGLHFVGITYKLALTAIQYEITGDESLLTYSEDSDSESETEAVTESEVSETTKFTVQVVVPDVAETAVTESAVSELTETVTETTVFTVEIIV